MSGTLPPERRLLARELRALKERSGLSIAALAARTTASKSSWQRYLSGALPPPRELVRELCVLAGEPPGRLVALWDMADAARRHAPAEPPPPRPQEPAPPAPRDHRRTTAVVAVGALAAVAAVVLGIRLADPSGPSSAPVATGCTGAACEGLHSQPQACGTSAAGPRTIVEHHAPGGRMVSIRHSDACDATWARMWFGHVGDRLEISAPDGRTQRIEIKDKYDAEGYLSTPMLGGGPAGTRACLVLAETRARHCVDTGSGAELRPSGDGVTSGSR
ncbi:XRE family transcriptional regulator [Streptomyces sp. TRM49041]|uniref:helix-turn-helix domain-containing protein n=1 Tax=Streptomyces sp. TRM49041 TaxID=2603216 RepID=UPI0011EBF717|nr:XRE family transcriptional regulator [Streptomyces sp. TRM49041]